ncbi:MAG: TlpA disulfide reductase family protein [Chthoniobacteraceae bacterium]
MIRLTALLFCMIVAVVCGEQIPTATQPPASSGSSSPPRAPSKIYWNNGESLTGELVGATATEATWKTPLFEDQLSLDWHALRGIDQPQASMPTTEPFSIALRDGSFIYGDLVSVTDKTVSIHSSRHGDATLDRSEVLNVRRLKGANLVFAGPTGDVGWSSQANARRNIFINNASAPAATIPQMIAGPAGSLLMPYWNRSAFLNVTFPDLVDVEFHVHSSRRPDFQLSLEAGFKERLRVETWDDDLVLTVSDQFKTIRKIVENERDVALRICWDRKARKCSVYTPAGKLIADWVVPEDSSGGSAKLVLQNKGRDLSLEFLRVRSWDGKPPAEIDATHPHVELADGRMLEGDISTESGSIKLHAQGQDAAESFPFSDMDAIVFSSDPPQIRDHTFTLSYSDGSLLMGSVTSISDGHAALKTLFTAEPLATSTDGLRQLVINASGSNAVTPESSIANSDKIVIQQTTLHGKLVSAGDGWPRWLPVGSTAQVTPSKEFTNEITLAFLEDAKIPMPPALFYMKTGDVLPGDLRSLDRSGAEFESDFVETKKLAAESLDAIQLGAVSQVKIQGFDDAGWRILKGDEKTVRKTKDSISMDPETVISHPSIMQSGEIKFTIDSSNFSTIRFRLFCSGTDKAQSSNLIISHMGNSVTTGMEASEGQLDNQTQIQIQSDQSLPVRLVIDETQIQLFLNNINIQTFPIDPSKRAGSGLIIEPSSLWGNSVNPISLSDFSATSTPGHTWLPNINKETKAQALTVPRFRKNDAPQHALLAANGDILRGEIEAATASHFEFRSGLENLVVPRDRVKAVIWLKKPDTSLPTSEPESPVLKQLDQKIEQHMRYGPSGLNILIGFIQQQDSGLKFKLPEKEDPRRFQMQFGGQTLGQALGRICSLFNLQYRVDKDGTIILEPSQQLSKDMVQKVYWLKASPFTDTAAAKEALVGKGISFPEGTALLWQPTDKMLVMTNTVANQNLLAQLLESDLGGSLGSPTHWLLLANGARFGLIVDKFEKDFIYGHHPVYGACKVPMSQVYIIRTSMPDSNTTMKSLHSWSLVYAPEPVIPEPGGDSSPTLGKDAKVFKLSLLDGGDFDLAREKGNIIVLDFWATWCGPCVKSLPGLIEAMSTFPAGHVKLIGVNQSEPPDQVKRFLETRGLKLTVAMDEGQTVAQQYGVDGIPHTVIIGPDGKVAWVKSGYSPDGETEAADAVKKLLALPTSPAPPAKEVTQ